MWKEFIKTLLRSEGKPVIYHCSAGKDRTGIASYIIQKLFSNSMDDIFKNYLLSNQLLTTKAATAEQTTSSNQDNILVTNIMLDTLAKVKKSYLLSAINEIKNNYSSLEKYICNELQFDINDLEKLKKLYSI